MRGKRYNSQNWANGNEFKRRPSRNQNNNFAKFKDMPNESVQSKSVQSKRSVKRNLFWKGQRENPKNKSWSWRDEDANRNEVNLFRFDKNRQKQAEIPPQKIHYHHPHLNSEFIPFAPHQNSPSTFNFNNTNNYLKVETPIPLMAFEAQPPFNNLAANNSYTRNISSTPSNPRKRYFDDNDIDSIDNNKMTTNRQMSIKIEKITPNPSPEPLTKSMSSESLIIDLSNEQQILYLDDDDDYNEESNNLMTTITTAENTVIAETETIPEIETVVENSQKKIKRTRRKQNACEICDIQGHNEMQCQMICRNCKERFHNSSKCTKPTSVHNTLTSFMDLCVKQFVAEANK